MQRLFRETAFDESAGVHSRRRMTLKVDLIAPLRSVLAAEKVIEGHFIERGCRGEGRNVPADARMLFVALHYHRHGVPTDVTPDAALDLQIAGVGRFLGGR